MGNEEDPQVDSFNRADMKDKVVIKVEDKKNKRLELDVFGQFTSPENVFEFDLLQGEAMMGEVSK